ncbi:hypothetical protein IMZ08_18010 [Bacillus luteolus]|uniref:Transmembrane protein n=1 Tax=Litchfieldia luteola TaxID=682179 RepID=A0ABR9QN50_9BACI|nr:hypothetical protein [Cytobacillus luteolus]MBE4909934.1 hypothetical protein [Cytobacillus luteolus]MBP1942510.1 putative membrane protein [Cytobacillus luteolus]
MKTTKQHQKEMKLTLWLFGVFGIILLIGLLLGIIPPNFWVICIVLIVGFPLILREGRKTIEEVKEKQARMLQKGVWKFIFVYGILLFGFPLGVFTALEEWGNTALFVFTVLSAMVIGGSFYGSIMYLVVKNNYKKYNM